jgi:hypothetical protein
MKKLLVIEIGGSISKANIEVHDVQVVIADCIESTYRRIKKK